MRVEQTEEFRAWIDNLQDRVGRARILMRVDRLVHGNAGTHRHQTEGVSELKVDHGPGYRENYSLRGRTRLFLLAGGDKSSQKANIEEALRLNRSLEE